MKVTKDNLFEYLLSVIDAIPDSKYVRVLLPEGEYKDIRSALDAIPPMGESLYDNGRMMVVYRGVRIEFVCDYLTDDEELTYVLLENEMLRGENENMVLEHKIAIASKQDTIDSYIRMSESYLQQWEFTCGNNSILRGKLDRIPKFIRKIFGAL